MYDPSETETYVIEGLLEAVIGVGLREKGTRVLVYDAYSVQNILETSGSELSVHAFIEELEQADLGERAPLFVWLDDDIKHGLADSSGSTYRLH